MLTEAEYKELLPHRDKILDFERTQSYKGNALQIIDHIRQRLYGFSICYSCQGSKASAINDAIGLIRQYEETNKIT